MPEVSIVVPVHGRAAVTLRCLESVFAGAGAEGPEFEVVVVDDASPEGTGELLAAFGDRIQLVTHDTNLGFSEACNDGAAAAAADRLVFLNSDTIATAGWLGALVAHAEANPDAAVIGSKLLFGNETIQHAGVVICQDRYPRHLYAGFPGDHPAPNRSRALQAVTGACMLVRRDAFEQAGGFDTSFRNSYEDVDLCLRLGEAGREVHYCAASVLYHLESASRDRSSKDVEESLKVYRSRWLDRVEPDDLRLYLEDGLISLDYDESYPLRLSVSAELATLTGDRETEADRLLALRARQVESLLREVTRLTGSDPVTDPVTASDSGGLTPREALERDEARQEALGLGYPRLVRRIREVAAGTLPGNATVLVVSKGDHELLRLNGFDAWHFPQEPDGAYSGRHPTDDREAVEQLETLREKGADFLLLPEPSFWWLDHYDGLRAHLESRYRLVLRDEQACLIYALGDGEQA